MKVATSILRGHSIFVNPANSHQPYKVFELAEARRLLAKLDLQYTPKHGSWLNMAEIELSVFSRQCLHRRIADGTTFQRLATIWSNQRNRSGATVDWRFTTADARIKLKHLYPVIQP